MIYGITRKSCRNGTQLPKQSHPSGKNQSNHLFISCSIDLLQHSLWIHLNWCTVSHYVLMLMRNTTKQMRFSNWEMYLSSKLHYYDYWWILTLGVCSLIYMLKLHPHIFPPHEGTAGCCVSNHTLSVCTSAFAKVPVEGCTGTIPDGTLLQAPTDHSLPAGRCFALLRRTTSQAQVSLYVTTVPRGGLAQQSVQDWCPCCSWAWHVALWLHGGLCKLSWLLDRKWWRFHSCCFYVSRALCFIYG